MLCGDDNEPLCDEPTGMLKLCSVLSMIVFMFHLTSTGNINTYICGKVRIGYILCDHRIVNAAITGCYEPF